MSETNLIVLSNSLFIFPRLHPVSYVNANAARSNSSPVFSGGREIVMDFFVAPDLKRNSPKIIIVAVPRQEVTLKSPENFDQDGDKNKSNRWIM